MFYSSWRDLCLAYNLSEASAQMLKQFDRYSRFLSFLILHFDPHMKVNILPFDRQKKLSGLSVFASFFVFQNEALRTLSLKGTTKWHFQKINFSQFSFCIISMQVQQIPQSF